MIGTVSRLGTDPTVRERYEFLGWERERERERDELREIYTAIVTMYIYTILEFTQLVQKFLFIVV